MWITPHFYLMLAVAIFILLYFYECHLWPGILCVIFIFIFIFIIPSLFKIDLHLTYKHPINISNNRAHISVNKFTNNNDNNKIEYFVIRWNEHIANRLYITYMGNQASTFYFYVWKILDYFLSFRLYFRLICDYFRNKRSYFLRYLRYIYSIS